MKTSILTAASIACLLSGCNTITNPEFVQEIAKAKQSAGANEIVGTWQSKTVVNSAVFGSAILHKTMHFEPGGGGTIRVSEKGAPNQQAQKGEAPLTWSYAGNGRWDCQYENARGMIHYTGRRLLMESYFILATESNGSPVTSVTHREVFDRPGSASLNEAVKKGAPTKIDWIFAP